LQARLDGAPSVGFVDDVDPVVLTVGAGDAEEVDVIARSPDILLVSGRA
jgi:hypothetical protein